MSPHPTSDNASSKLYLVTGGSGFIGSNLVEHLLKRGHRVRVLDNLYSGDIKYINLERPDLEFIKGSVCDMEAVIKAVAGVDGVFHMAAMSKVLPSLENPEMIDFCTEQNLGGTLNVLKAVSRLPQPRPKVVYSASSTFYGLNPVPQSESQLPDLQTPYALTKYIGELYCEMFSRLYGVQTVRLRYFMVFGPREPSSGAYAIVSGIFQRLKEKGQALTIDGDGSQTRDFVHVYDVAEANLRAMESPKLYNHMVNVGTGVQTSIKALADSISKEQVHRPPRPIDLKATEADCTRCKELFGWVPQINILDVIKQYGSTNTAFDYDTHNARDANGRV